LGGDAQKRFIVSNTENGETDRERHFQNLLDLLETYLQLVGPSQQPPATAAHLFRGRPAHMQWRAVRHRVEAICFLWLASPAYSIRCKALSVLDLFNSTPFRYFLIICIFTQTYPEN
jgi:hypothetical protein